MSNFNLFANAEEFTERIGSSGSRMTRREMKEIQEKFRKEKEIYEREKKVLMSEERKKALYR